MLSINSGISFSYNSANYSGASAYSYVEAYSKICDLVNRLEPIVRDNLFSKVHIEYNCCNHSPGSYSDENDTITLRDLSDEALFAECTHATQDQLNLGGKNRAAREYQEKILGDFKARIRTLDSQANYSQGQGPRGYPDPVTRYNTVRSSDSTTFNEYAEWVEGCIDNKTKEIDMSLFLPRAREFEGAFQSFHADIPGYQGDIPQNYEYNWRQMFKNMGFKIKN